MSDDSMIRLLDDSISKSNRVITSFKELIVYKRAFAISLEMHRATLNFPKIEQYALADQLRRASKSICANVAEGFIKQKYSTVEFARFLSIAEASANEVLVWIDYAVHLDYITQDTYLRWENEYAAIGAMLNKLRRKL